LSSPSLSNSNFKVVEQRLFIFLASLLFVAGAFVPFVADTGLPIVLKKFHSLEIIGDSLIYSIVLVYLFKKR
jgi:hypothetical protein